MRSVAKGVVVFGAVLAGVSVGVSSANLEQNTAKKDVDQRKQTEEIHVWGESLKADDPGYMSPTSVLTPVDMLSINAATTEDLVKFEPSLVIRRRFIGDSNGTIGMRGSNMFQTSRSMVFADGVPLHYLLQSRWNGAPRWTMVSASEIAQVDVMYGPFSAEYSGNAMGGVVLIETAIPQEAEFHADISYFSQDFAAYGYDDTVDGYKGFVSYGNKVGDWSYYLSFNRLDNDAQPQTFRGSSYVASESSDTVSGGVFGLDARERNGVVPSYLFYGDTGVVSTETNNAKFKLGYSVGEWNALLNVAFEDRNSENAGNTYIRDSSGQTLWSGSGLVQDGQTFSFSSGQIGASELTRESLSMGLRVKGPISEAWQLEANINQFDILKDVAKSSNEHPLDPVYTNTGEVSEFDDSGWQTAEVKVTGEDVIVDGLSLVAGFRHENYALNISVFDSNDYHAGSADSITNSSGGKTAIDALYSQANWQMSPKWQGAFGLRYEHFRSYGGYYDDDDSQTPELDLTSVPRSSHTTLSPKFSLGFIPADDWLVRYSLAKAYRFPIAEELFSRYEMLNSSSVSNPGLQPENGLHHNLMFNKDNDHGYYRVNVFQENVKNAIESQTDSVSGRRTFVPIDEVETWGLELIVNQNGFGHEALDVRFNLTWTDAEIVDNSSAEGGVGFDPNDSYEGNTYPRMSKWRGNVLATFHVNDQWRVGGSVRYASDAFGRLENDDRVNNVYGAQDSYTRLGVKSSYDISRHVSVSVGVDNLTNDIDYVAHPWPGRTLYATVSYDM